MVRCALSLLLCLIAAARGDWPPKDEDLVFLFETGTEEIFALDANGSEPLLNYSLKPSGQARFTGQGLMNLGHGRYRAPAQERLGKVLAGSPQLGIEVWLWPEAAQQAEILNLCGALTLEQRGERLICRLQTAAGAIEVGGPLPPGQASAVALSLSADRLSLFRDGVEVQSVSLSGPVQWRDLGPSFGSGDFETAGWSGRLGFFGVYAGAFDAARAAAHCSALAENLQPPPEPLVVEAKLLACSTSATPASIEPYADSLAVFEYEVQAVVKGLTWDKTIRVAHYVVLDHHALPAAAAKPGDLHRLVLEPFAANRQVALVHRTETLAPDPKVRLYLATQILSP